MTNIELLSHNCVGCDACVNNERILRSHIQTLIHELGAMVDTVELLTNTVDVLQERFYEHTHED